MYSGLLEKCPAISFIDRTVTTDDEIGQGVRRRANAYQFNHGCLPCVVFGRFGVACARDDHDDHDDNDDHDDLTVMMQRGILQLEARFRQLQQT